MLCAVLQDPEQKQQVRGYRLKEKREIDVMRAKPHTIFAELRAPLLIDGLDLFGDGVPLQNAKIFTEPERDAACEARNVLGFRDLDQRLQPHFDVMGKPSLDPR